MENNHTRDEYTIRKPMFIPLNQEPFLTYWTFDDTSLTNREKFRVLMDDNMGEIKDVSNNCNLANKRISCQYEKLMEGNYSFKLQLLDNWRCCVDNGVYYTSTNIFQCLWTTNNLERIIPKNTKNLQLRSLPNSNKTIIHSVIIVVVCLTVLFPAIYCFIKKRKNSFELSGPEEIVEMKALKKPHTSKLFLLYARDCVPLMEAMGELRRYLAIQSGYKVYDIYDSSQFNELSKSPFDYIQTLLQDNCNVVVIATKCSELLLKAASDSSKDVSQCLYRNLQPIDRFMIYALKLISYDTAKMTYKKFFVVRLPDFNDSKDYLVHINPGIRYDLPRGLDTLLENLASVQPTVTQDSLLLKENLRSTLYALKQYVLHNPEYLRDHILNDHLFI